MITKEEKEILERTDYAHKEQSREYLNELVGHLERIEKLANQGQPNAAPIVNAACHLNLACHDVLTMIYLISKVSDGYSHRAVCRFLATVMYEATDDLRHLLGKDFFSACERVGISESVVRDIKKDKKLLSKFFDEHGPILKEIREVGGAHRDHNALKFIASLRIASPDRLLEIARAFKLAVNPLVKACELILRQLEKGISTKQ